MAKASVPRSKMVKRPYKKRYMRKSKPSFLSRAVDMGTKVAKLAGTVKTIASMINAEKKYIDNVIFDSRGVGQCAGSLPDWLLVDCTPKPAQGAAVNQRNGQSIKLNSMLFRFVIQGQSGLVAPTRVKMMLFKVTDPIGPLPGTFATEIIEPDSLTTLVDFFSRRNPNYFSQYKLVSQRIVRLRGDAYSGQVGNQADVIWNVKTPHHIRFKDNTTTVSQGQYVMLVVCDTGNNSGGTSQLPFVSNPQPNSGIIISGTQRAYYYDN